MKETVALILISFFLISCNNEHGERADSTEQGVKPIYQIFSDADIVSEQAKSFGQLGKIVSRGNFIFINEVQKGIHVIDNTNPSSPITKYFWSIPGNLDFTLKDSYLYADIQADLLTIDISNPEAIKLVSKIEGANLNVANQSFPQDYFGPFECVDSDRGIVVGWEEALLINPECRI